MEHTRLRRTAAVSLFTAVLACGENITNTGTDLPENRGTDLQSTIDVEAFTELAWSADGSEVYFEANGPPARLFAAPLSGGAPRELDGGRDAYIDLSVAPDGSALYFAADFSNGRRSAYRLPLDGGDAVAVTDRAPGSVATFRADGKVILPAPSGANVAYTVAPDSVFMYAIASDTHTFIARGCERLIAFSPDGVQLLCVTGAGGAGAHVQIDLAARTATSVQPLPPSEGVPQMIRWDAQGIRVLYQPTFGGLSLWQNGGRRDVFELPDRGGLLLDQRNSDWSAAGDRVALWIHECLRRRGLNDCERGQSILYIVDLIADRSDYVAVVHGEVGGQFMALAPAASRVAYVFGGDIYHQSTSIPSQ